MLYPDAEIAHQMWVFTGGAILMLLQSIISNARRNWWSLLIGGFFGGLGAVLGWGFLQDWDISPYAQIFLTGVAAVVAENILAGFVNASKQFAESPLKVATHLARTFLPTFGKTSGDTSNPVNTDELK